MHGVDTGHDDVRGGCSLSRARGLPGIIINTP